MNKYSQSKQSVLMHHMFLNDGATMQQLQDALFDAGFAVDMDKDLVPILASYHKRGWVTSYKGTYRLNK